MHTSRLPKTVLLLSLCGFITAQSFGIQSPGGPAGGPAPLSLAPIFSFPLDTDPGWSRQGQWAFGKPSGLGGTSHGSTDPTSGATGSNVFGVNLSGDYSTTVGGPYYLTAGPLNLSGRTGTTLQFQRWLNSDYSPFVNDTVEVSSNGVTWTKVWTNPPGVFVTDANWNLCAYDISAVADNQTNVYIRWSYQVSAGAYAFSGWNIDDIQLLSPSTGGLALSLPASATDGDGLISCSVTATPAPTNDLPVTLTCNMPTRLSIASGVTIQAGKTNFTFFANVLNDGVLDGTQVATVTASAINWTNGAANITLYDKQTATLSVSFPGTVTEGQANIQGSVQISAAPASNVVVNLSSSDTTALQVPASVTVLAGQTSANFTATAPTDALLDGSKNLNLTAHVQNWTDGVAPVTVLDNKSTGLTVVLPAQVNQGAGTITNGGQVYAGGLLLTNLTVTLAAGTPSRLTIPPTVTILAGQSNAYFNLGIADNGVSDGNHTNSVTATAPGLTQGTASVVILNNNADHFTFSTIASPQTAGAAFTVTITACDPGGATVTGFTNSVTLTANTAAASIAMTPAASGAFLSGQWTGSLTITTNGSGVVVTASDGKGHTGSSNPFLVARPTVLISAANRVDMVQDDSRGILYISDKDRVLRYDLSNNVPLAPFIFGTSLYGIDISPDNKTLIVADTSGIAGGSNWVYVVDLPSGNVSQAMFPLAFGEGGTYAVAFGNDGAALISSTFQGSGWVPLRRYDPATSNVTVVANPRQNSMVSASGDGSIIAVAEANISSGPLDRYNVGTRTVTGSVGDGWFNYECAVNRNGSQFAVPTYGGTFIYDTNLSQVALLGTYASEGPIGLAYHPQADLVYFAWWPTTFVRAYETHTMAEVARYDSGYSFGWTGNGAFGQGRVRTSRNGNNIFVTVSGGVRWIPRPVDLPADLSLTMTAPSASAGNNLTYSITVSNAGPNAVNDARVFDRLPAGASLVSYNASQGTTTVSNTLLTFSLGPTLASGGTATISITVLPPNPGVLSNSAAVFSLAADANPANNSAVLISTVHAGILGVLPPAGTSFSGVPGGPFSPASQMFVLTNSGDATLTWAASHQSAWLAVSPATGQLAPGATTNVTISPTASANSLARGAYTDPLNFTNSSFGLGSTNFSVSLTANTTPVATPKTVSLSEDGTLVILLQGTDADGDALTASVTSLPLHGVLYQTVDGFTPASQITSVPALVSNISKKVIFSLPQHGYGSGYGNFQFKVNDGLADSSNAVVTVNVTHVNHPPVAGPLSAAFTVGTAQLQFNVLQNCFDVDGDPLTVNSFTSPSRGALALSNGVFTFQPNPAFTSGQDQFQYTISDGAGGSATNQVTITAYARAFDSTAWPMYGNGPAHTGYFPGTRGSNALSPLWSTNFGIALNQVAIGGGKVFVTPVTYFSTTFLAALDAATGLAAWQHNFVSAFSINPPSYDGGRVYVQRGDAGSDTQLWCLGSTNGTVLWNAPFGAQWERYYSPTIYGGSIWVDGGYYGGMYGFTTNGVQLFFNNSLQQYDEWTPAYYQGTVYSWVGGVFNAHNPATGTILWSANLGWNWNGWSMNTVPVMDGGLALIYEPPNLLAVDLTTHTNRWVASGVVNSYQTGSPAVANGIVYSVTGDHAQAFVAQTGTPLGIYQATNDTGLSGQPIVTDDSLLMASSTATYIFDLGSHQLVQTIPYGGQLSIAGGILYIAGGDGWLRAYSIPASQGPGFSALVVTQGTGSRWLKFRGLPGWTYRIQYRDVLGQGTWHDLASVTPSASGVCQCIDPAPNGTSRYYRAVWP